MTGITFGVRSATDSPMGLTRSLAAALAGVDRDLTFNIRSLTDQVSASVTQERVVAVLSGAFGLLALVLAGLGLFGRHRSMGSSGVRRHEIGIRLAIGATARQRRPPGPHTRRGTSSASAWRSARS